MSTKPRWHPGALLLFLLVLIPPRAHPESRPPDPVTPLLREARAGLVERIQVARQRLIDLDDRAIARGNRDPVRQRRINRLLGIAPAQIGAVYESTAVCAATLELLRCDPLFREPTQYEALTDARDAALQLLLPLVPGCRYLVSADRALLLSGQTTAWSTAWHELPSLPLPLLGSTVPPPGVEDPGPIPVTGGPAVEVGGGRTDWRGLKPIPGRDEAIAWTDDALFRIDLTGETPPRLLGPIAHGTTPDVSGNGAEVAALIPQPTPGDTVLLGIRRLDGRGEWRMIHDLRPGPPSFAPHRPLLAWMAGEQVRVWDLEGDSLLVRQNTPDLVMTPVGPADTAPSWSPDGRSIQFGQVVFCDITGTTRTERIPEESSSADASRPLRAATRRDSLSGSSRRDATAMPISGARPPARPLRKAALQAPLRLWDVDSRRILSVSSQGTAIMAPMGRWDEERTILTAPAGWQYTGVAPSPDGRWLVASRQRADRAPLDTPIEDPADPLDQWRSFDIAPADRPPATLCDPGPPVETADGTLLWHPGSRWLLASIQAGRAPCLAVFDLSTGGWTALAPGPIRNVRFTSDGKRLVWREEIDGGSRIVSRPFELRPTGVGRARRVADEGRIALERWENGPALARFLDAARLSGLDPTFYRSAGTAAERLAVSTLDPLQAEVAWNAATRWNMSAHESRADHLDSWIGLNDAVGRWAVLRGWRLGTERRTAAIAALDEVAPPPADGDKYERARSLCEQALLWNPWNDVSRVLLDGLMARPDAGARR